MKQSEIVTGYEHYVKTKPYEQNEYEWTGLSSYRFPDDTEIVCIVLAKGIEQNRRKDRIEVRPANTERYGEATYLVPARHIVESVKGRAEREAQEAYNQQWAEAIRENNLRGKVDSYRKGALGDLIEDRETEARRGAGKVLGELRNLKAQVDKMVAEFEEASVDGADSRTYNYKLKDDAKYPGVASYAGIRRVLSEGRDLEDAVIEYGQSANLINELRRIEAKSEAEETEES